MSEHGDSVVSSGETAHELGPSLDIEERARKVTELTRRLVEARNGLYENRYDLQTLIGLRQEIQEGGRELVLDLLGELLEDYGEDTGRMLGRAETKLGKSISEMGVDRSAAFFDFIDGSVNGAIVEATSSHEGVTRFTELRGLVKYWASETGLSMEMPLDPSTIDINNLSSETDTARREYIAGTKKLLKDNFTGAVSQINTGRLGRHDYLGYELEKARQEARNWLVDPSHLDNSPTRFAEKIGVCLAFKIDQTLSQSK